MSTSGYDKIREDAARRRRELSRSGRDIGALPPIQHPRCRAKARNDFAYFCRHYFPKTFHLPWSPDHLKLIRKIELAVRDGGLFAMATPRGFGKTCLCETACLWAMLYGYRSFVALISSEESLAVETLDSMKLELETNDQLLADFPEVVFPIRAMEGIHQRAMGQLYQGELTYIGWSAKEVVLPTIPGSKAGGAIVRVAGLTGRIRGMKFKRPDGYTARPSLVVLDDPQTDESARSPSQCQSRERIVAGAILGLAGPGQKIAGLLPTTVICRGDLADRFLDRDAYPQWQGERTKMLYSFPTDEALWAKYAEVRADGLRHDRGTAEATKFYGKHRIAMDKGAAVAWPEQYDPDELSAVQHAMNLKLQDEIAFWAEYQNEPMPEEVVGNLVSVEDLAGKLNGVKRGLVPVGCSYLTAYIDSHANALYWLVVAWEDGFTGYVVDYGTEPEQPRPYFTLSDIRKSLAKALPRAGPEGALYGGYERLVSRVMSQEWPQAGGGTVRVGRCLFDAQWALSTDVVYQFCQQSELAAILTPAHGRGVGAAGKPFSEHKRKRGERRGLNWWMPVASSRRAIRHITYDTNFWKSFTHARLAVSMGDSGCLSVFGRKAARHRLLFDHLVAEYRVKTEGRGRTVDEWKPRPNQPDNHWLDCLVGCAVAASMEGVSLRATKEPDEKPRRIRLSDLQGKR